MSDILHKIKTMFIKNNVDDKIICDETLDQNTKEISTVKDLAGKTYYKISKSTPDIRKVMLRSSLYRISRKLNYVF